jgi:hypothetical protein
MLISITLSICFQRQKRNKFAGVYFNKNTSKYIGQFAHEKNNYYCGYFLNELEAAQAVNAKCVELDIPLKNPEVGLPENKPYNPQVKFDKV